jgi:hypothetical protein
VTIILFPAVADPPVGVPATATPFETLLFSFFLHKTEKIRVILPRMGFKNHFFTMIATPLDKVPPPH